MLGGTYFDAGSPEFDAFGASELRVNEALVVKYDASTGNNCLPVHQDFSLLTINVALSERADFTGGGTWFQHSDLTLLADVDAEDLMDEGLSQERADQSMQLIQAATATGTVVGERTEN